MPFETYATLLNLKKVLPSAKSNYVAVEKDYWIDIFSNTVGEVDVDHSWYLQKYSDVADAVRDGLVLSARDHYRRFGYFEHRMPYPIDVNPSWYLAQYSDVQSAISQNVFRSAQEHFEELGFREGRHPYPGFALRKTTDPVEWDEEELRRQI